MRWTLPVVAVLILGSVSAADWHHWRGPSANGAADASADPPTTWDGPSGRNVKWKAPLPGRGSATPVVWGDQVIVVSATKTDRAAAPSELPKPDPRFERRTDAPRHFYRFDVTAFDRATGKQIWQKTAAEKVPHEGHHTTHSYAAGSPTTDGERLYVSFGSFGVYCFDRAGNIVWSRDLGRLNTRLGWGEAVTPVVHSGRLVLNWDQEADAVLYCLDAQTGATKWSVPRDEKSTWSTPLVTEYHGRTQVILNGTTRVRSYDLADGSLVWSVAGMTVNPIPSPVRIRDTAVMVSGYKGAAAVAVPLDANGDLGMGGPVTWRYGRGTPYVPSPAVVDGRLYFTERNDALLTVLDAQSGKAVINRERLPGVTSFYASPVFAGGRVYLVDRSGTTIVLRPGDTVDVLATNKLGDPVDASPIAVGKDLYLRGEQYLWCLAAK